MITRSTANDQELTYNWHRFRNMLSKDELDDILAGTVAQKMSHVALYQPLPKKPRLLSCTISIHIKILEHVQIQDWDAHGDCPDRGCPS